MAAPLQRRYAEVDGFSLSYVDREAEVDPCGDPILMLHGLIATGETFSSLIEELPANRRVIALDMPGSGFSARDLQADVSFAGTARLVAGFMQQVGIERPILLGHSHGGAISLRVAVEHPELLRAMVLLAPANPFSTKGLLLIRFYLSWLGGRVARLLPRFPAWMHAIGFYAMAGPGSKCDWARLEVYRQSGKVPGTIEHFLRLLKTWQADMDDLRARLKAHSIMVPTLLLWGDDDRVVPETSAIQLEKYLLNSQRVTLRRIGHLPNEEDPLQCGSVLRDWLVRLDALPTETE